MHSIFLIIAINLIFYFKTLRLNYVSDDLPIYHNCPVKSNNKWQFRWQQFMGTRRVNPPQDHLITLAIHIISCCLIYLAFGRNHISLLAAILFSLNPANNQVSIWVSGRGYALLTMGMTGAMAFPYLAPLFLFNTIGWTMGFLSPLAFIGSDYMWFFTFLPILWLYHAKGFAKRAKKKLEDETADEDKRLHPKKFIVAIKTMGFYFTLCLIPFKLTFYHSFLQSMAGNDISQKRAYTIKDKFFWIGVAVILTWGLHSIINGWDIFSWCLFWYMITIAPFCNLLRRNQEIAERYLYLPSVGLMVGLAHLIINSPIAITFFITFYAVRLFFFYKTAYVDDYWVVESAVQEDTASWFAWHMRGHKRFSQGALREAINMFVMAKMMSPHEFKLLFNIGSILIGIKHKEEGLAWLKKAEEHIVKGQEEQSQKVLKDAREGKVPVIL